MIDYSSWEDTVHHGRKDMVAEMWAWPGRKEAERSYFIHTKEPERENRKWAKALQSQSLYQDIHKKKKKIKDTYFLQQGMIV